jgi:hypothetical protein
MLVSTELLIALIGAIATVVVALATAVVTYLFAKKRERDAEIRKEKLEHYKDFILSVSGIVGESSAEAQRAFSTACNRLNLMAPQSVLRAVQTFQQTIKVSNTESTAAQHDEALSALLLEIRRDLKVSPSDADGFVFGLWAPGGAVKRS